MKLIQAVVCGIKPALRLICLFNVALCSACRPGSPLPRLRGGKRKPMPRASSGHDTNANDQGAAASIKTDIVTPLYSVALYALSVIFLTYGFSV